MGTGCNHYEIMVTTEKRNSVNIVFYLSKVISPKSLDSVCTPRFPKIRKIHIHWKEQEKNQERKRLGIFSVSISFIVQNFMMEGTVRGENCIISFVLLCDQYEFHVFFVVFFSCLVFIWGKRHSLK